MRHLFSTCLLSDGHYWLRIAASGKILECSACGFSSLADAIKDFRDRFGQ